MIGLVFIAYLWVLVFSGLMGVVGLALEDDRIIVTSGVAFVVAIVLSLITILAAITAEALGWAVV